MSKFTVQRRSFVKLGLLSSAFVVLYGLKHFSDLAKIPKKFYSTLILANFVDVNELERLGEIYLLKNPSENTLEKIESRLLEDAIIDKENGTFTRSHISATILRDFKSADTVVLNGWIVSLTEARMCAYLKLS